MKKKYKVIIICLGLIIFLAIGLYGGFINSGSYPYAQQYEFNTSDTVLIKAIESYKKNNPAFNVPEQFHLYDANDNYRYNFYLYDLEKAKIFHCFVMTANGSNKSSIFLTAVNEGITLGNWKVVNRDYDRTQNLQIKRELQQSFLNKLKLSYKDEGNGAFVFWK